MNDASKNCKIKILKNGPYVVTGNVPISEKIITPKGNEYEFLPGRELPQSATYALCRCGKTKTPPFCDGAHTPAHFLGKETASKQEYRKRSTLMRGATLDLLDDGRCAFARFCHRKNSDAWELTKYSWSKENKEEAIIASNECPAGRLTAVEKDGTIHEPHYEPAIEIMQDPERRVSAAIFVKGGIPIESADGTLYETRNRVALCRCGESEEKPFCDARHVVIRYRD